MTTLTFIRVDRVIRVPSPDTAVTIQEIYDQSQDWLDEPSQMDIQHFLSAGGKESLGAGEFVGVTLTLVNDWRVEFEPRAGPSTISCVVSEGNIVAVNSFSNNPIKPSTFTQVQIRQSQSPTALDLGGTSLTAQEVVDALKAEIFDVISFEDLMAELLSAASGRIVESSTDVFDFYDRAGTTVLFTLTKTATERNRT